MNSRALGHFVKIFGPGLLYAGAAIGVSHLVQSTRAGAMFNFNLVWVLIVANFLKYPFFEYGPRYATATGTSLVDGYYKIGKWAVIVFAVLTILSMFIVQAAVTVVTVGIMAYVFQITIEIKILCVMVLIVSAIFLISGKYSALDKVIKFIIILLALSTVVAVFASLGIQSEISPETIHNFNWTNATDVFFLIAFIGWMPAPIDVSVWSSIWNLEKNKDLGYVPTMRNVLLEFKIGYIGTAFLALGFLTLGALVMSGTGNELSTSGVVFAGQLINMYTDSIGSWAYWIISIAALTTMLSTTITVLDAYSRVMNPIVKYLLPGVWKKFRNKDKLRWFWYIFIIAGAAFILAFAAKSMVHMVTMATTLSFLMAPVFAWLNYKVVTDDHMPITSRPGKFLRVLSWLGIIFFTVFSLVYIYWRFLI
ncbi:MAG: Nramp family divalent metal transporter [Bacteroidetes bacterium]|nr:Nramp family divalent metal transporter [Bacteroidota bacterium]